MPGAFCEWQGNGSKAQKVKMFKEIIVRGAAIPSYCSPPLLLCVSFIQAQEFGAVVFKEQLDFTCGAVAVLGNDQFG